MLRLFSNNFSDKMLNNLKTQAYSSHSKYAKSIWNLLLDQVVYQKTKKH